MRRKDGNIFTRSIKGLLFFMGSVGLLSMSSIPHGGANLDRPRSVVDTLYRYEIRDSSITRQIDLLMDETCFPLLKDKDNLEILICDMYGDSMFKLTRVPITDTIIDVITHVCRKLLFGWNQYRGSIFLLCGRKMPWLDRTNEKKAIETFLPRQQKAVFPDQPLGGVSATFQENNGKLFLFSVLQNDYAQISDDYYWRGFSENTDHPLIEPGKVLKKTFDEYVFRDNTLIPKMESLMEKTCFPISDSEKTSYIMRFIEGNCGETLIYIINWDPFPFSDFFYWQCQRMEDLLGLVQTDRCVFILQGSVPSEILEKTDRRKTLHFRSFTFEEEMQRFEKLSCDAFIFSYDGDQLKLAFLLAEC